MPVGPYEVFNQVSLDEHEGKCYFFLIGIHWGDSGIEAAVQHPTPGCQGTKESQQSRRNITPTDTHLRVCPPNMGLEVRESHSGEETQCGRNNEEMASCD